MSNNSSHFIQINGIRLHYREWGSVSSPDLILIHGWATSSVIWHEVATELSNSYHIIALDNRGNGESEIPDRGYHISQYVKDVVALIDQLDLKKPAFIGNSWGANIGTYIAAEYPTHISKAVLEDPVYWKMIDAFVTVVPWITERQKRSEQVRREALKQGMSAEQADRAVYLVTHFSSQALRQVSSINRDWALQCNSYLARIAVPSLILIADQNAGGYVSEEELEHHKAHASNNVQFQKWVNVGHLMHVEQPERFIQKVRTFLSES